MIHSAPNNRFLRQVENSETEIVVTLDVTSLYAKVAAALGKTCLRRVIICQMARALPFPKNIDVPRHALAGNRQASTG